MKVPQTCWKTDKEQLYFPVKIIIFPIHPHIVLLKHQVYIIKNMRAVTYEKISVFHTIETDICLAKWPLSDRWDTNTMHLKEISNDLSKITEVDFTYRHGDDGDIGQILVDGVHVAMDEPR